MTLIFHEFSCMSTTPSCTTSGSSEAFSVSSLLHRCIVLCINLWVCPPLWGFPFILWGPQYAFEINHFIQFNWLQQFYLKAPSKSTGVGCRFLLQEIFPTQGLNPGLPHCRQTLYRLSHQGSSKIWEGRGKSFPPSWNLSHPVLWFFLLLQYTDTILLSQENRSAQVCYLIFSLYLLFSPKTDLVTPPKCFPKTCFVSWGEDEDLDLHGQCFVGFPAASFRVTKSPKHAAPPISHLCHDDVTWPKKLEAKERDSFRFLLIRQSFSHANYARLWWLLRNAEHF